MRRSHPSSSVVRNWDLLQQLLWAFVATHTAHALEKHQAKFRFCVNTRQNRVLVMKRQFHCANQSLKHAWLVRVNWWSRTHLRNMRMGRIVRSCSGSLCPAFLTTCLRSCSSGFSCDMKWFRAHKNRNLGFEFATFQNLHVDFYHLQLAVLFGVNVHRTCRQCHWNMHSTCVYFVSWFVAKVGFAFRIRIQIASTATPFDR